METLPGTDERSYRTWLPTPNAVGGERAYQFFRLQPPNILDFEESLTAEPFEKLTQYGDDMETLFGYSDLSELIVGPDFNVAHTSIEQNTIRAELSNNEFSEQETVESFSIFTDDQPPETAVGVADGTVIRGETSGGSSRAIVETVVKAHGDEKAQSQSVHDAFGALSEGLNNGHFLTGAIHQPHEKTVPEQAQFEGAVGWRISQTFKKTESPGQWLIVFESEEAADEEAVKSWAEASLTDVNTIKAAQAGRTVLVTGKEPTEKLVIHETLPTAE